MEWSSIKKRVGYYCGGALLYGIVGGYSLLLMKIFGDIEKSVGQKAVRQYRANEEFRMSQLQFKVFQTNGIEYISLPINGKEIRLYHHNGKYSTIEKIREDFGSSRDDTRRKNSSLETEY